METVMPEMIRCRRENDSFPESEFETYPNGALVHNRGEPHYAATGELVGGEIIPAEEEEEEEE
jgi:hypothetical protein